MKIKQANNINVNFTTMTEQEMKALAIDLCTKRINEATARMENMTICKDIFAELKKAGWGKQAKAFRDLVFTWLLAEPQITERELLTNLKNEFGF